MLPYSCYSPLLNNKHSSTHIVSVSTTYHLNNNLVASVEQECQTQGLTFESGVVFTVIFSHITSYGDCAIANQRDQFKVCEMFKRTSNDGFVNMAMATSIAGLVTLCSEQIKLTQLRKHLSFK